MAFLTFTSKTFEQVTTQLASKVWVVALVALFFAAGTYFVPKSLLQVGFAAISGTLLCVGVGIVLLSMRYKRARSKAYGVISDFVEKDASPSFITDDDGEIGYRNISARKRFEDQSIQTLAGTLRDVFANPAAVLFRLKNSAFVDGAAREDVVTRRGHVRISVHRVGESDLLWRLEEMAGGRSPQRSDTLNIPLLTVGRSDAILSMNEAARQLIGERAKSLDRIFPSLPIQSGMANQISTAKGLQTGLIVEIEGVAGRREVFLFPNTAQDAQQPEGWRFFDELPVAMLKLAHNSTVEMSNQLARKLLGQENCDGKRLPDLMEGLGRSISDWLAEASQGRGLQHSEFLRVTRSDKEVFVQVTLKPIIDAGKPALIAVLNDATDLKTLEAQFVQSQKMQAIGQLAGGVAHDFNNLLTAISGHCDLLLLRHDQGDSDYSDLTQINQNANRAAALVSQLLAFSRKQTLSPEILDLRDTLSDMTHLLNRLIGEKVTLSLSHDPLLPTIRADKRQLEQVLMNLIVNARDAMPSGGEISIETENVVLSASLKRDRAVVAPGAYVSLKVSDDGVGIPHDKQRKVFEPFFTTKRTGEGTGLGLSMAYGIVKQSGGFIFIDSEPGQGTCFTLLFPVHEASAADTMVTVTAPLPSPNVRVDGVVLLVEDEAPVRAFASRALRMRGYTVLEAESAEDALKTLEDEDLKVDVFVTDVVMPGMDGPSWVREALKNRPGVRVVFVSGYAEDAFGDNQTRIPNSVFLPKPFSLVELTETVQRQLH